MVVEEKSRRYPALALFSSLSIVSVQVVANDGNAAPKTHQVHSLSGKYGWTTQQTCVRTLPNAPGTVAIDPEPPNRLNVPAEIVGMSGVGTATFRKDGTLHIDSGSWANDLRHSQISPGQTPMTGGFSPVCDGTYSIEHDNRATVDWNCRIDVQSQPGLAIQAGPVNWDGYVADKGRTIDLTLKGTRQTLTFVLNGNPVAEVQRLCIQRFVFHKLPE